MWINQIFVFNGLKCKYLHYITTWFDTTNNINYLKLLLIWICDQCLTPLLSCDGWELTTVEGLGSRKTGLHPVQKTLAAFHGTQCGFCSPGMVMQMNRYHKKNNSLSLLLAVLILKLLSFTKFSSLYLFYYYLSPKIN